MEVVEKNMEAVRGLLDQPQWVGSRRVSYLQIEERELEAGGLN